MLIQLIKYHWVLTTAKSHDMEKLLKWYIALASVAQWIEYWPANQRVTGSIPSQGTRLGCGPGPQQGACERQPHIDVSLPLFLPSYSKNK